MPADIHTLLTALYEATRDVHGGAVADYIPQLAEVNPDLYGVAFCDLNGTVTGVGDYQHDFCIQSCSKPLTYCLARSLCDGTGDAVSDDVASDTPSATDVPSDPPSPPSSSEPPVAPTDVPSSVPDVHDHVGYEPSGRSFNEFVLNRAGLPHNPLINAGAIMVASLVRPDAEPATRFAAVQAFYRRLAGHYRPIGFDHGVYLSERHHADRNISLAYYMRENRAFNGYPTPSQIQDHLDLYYQCCSVTASCEVGAVMAATLANRGTCPVTGEAVVDPAVVQDTLSIMYGCGMYDFSGQFGFEVGLPAKSGVSGNILLVIPNVGGICVWSPKLDRLGNSVRGLAFCHAFTRMTHAEHHLFAQHAGARGHSPQNALHRVMYAASKGDVAVLRAADAATLSEADYDGRTPLHLACAEGHGAAVKYLVDAGVPTDPKDRWGNTPAHEASKHGAKLGTAERAAWEGEILLLG